MGIVRLLDVRDEQLSVDEVLAAFSDPSTGCICLFVGTVRDVDRGKSVTKLEYNAHPSVSDVLRDVTDEIASTSPVNAMDAVHRVGELKVGDIAVVVAAAAPHDRRGVGGRARCARRLHRGRGSRAADQLPRARGFRLTATHVRRVTD